MKIKSIGMSTQVLGSGTAPLLIKKHSLDEDYEVFSNNILGLGISGKVLACIQKRTGRKCALKASLYNINGKFVQLSVLPYQ